MISFDDFEFMINTCRERDEYNYYRGFIHAYYLLEVLSLNEYEFLRNELDEVCKIKNII